MKLMTSLGNLSTYLFIATSAFAAPEEQAPSQLGNSPPLRAPVRSEWTITIQKRSAENPEKSETTKVSVVKNGDIYLQTTVAPRQGPEKLLVTPTMQFLKKADDDRVIRLLPGDAAGGDFSKTDFPSLYWTSDYVPSKEETTSGREVFVFRADLGDVPATNRERSDLELLARMEAAFNANSASPNAEASVAQQSPSTSGLVQALIDVETRLPIQFERPGESQVYRFSTPSVMAIPKPLQTAMDGWNQELKRIRSTPIPP